MVTDSQGDSAHPVRRMSVGGAASRLLQSDAPRQALLDASADIADGYYEIDLKGRLVAVNSSFCHMLGCAEAAQVINSDPNRFLDLTAQERIRQALRRVRETGVAAHAVECTITRADGEPRALEFSISLLRSSANQPIGFRGIVRDVTERVRAFNRRVESVRESSRETVRLYETLQAQFADLRSLYSQVSDMEQLKTHMIRVAAHDLRSPLSIIASYIDLLDDDLKPHYSEMDRHYVNAIRQAISAHDADDRRHPLAGTANEHCDVTLTRVQLGALLDHTVAELREESPAPPAGTDPQHRAAGGFRRCGRNCTKPSPT